MVLVVKDPFMEMLTLYSPNEYCDKHLDKQCFLRDISIGV